MSLDRLLNVLVIITLIEMMVLVGLGVTFAELVDTGRNWRLVARAMAANYLFVPGAAIVLLILFAATPAVASGFLILAVCPGAPFGPPFARIARANLPVAVGLMVILAGSSSVVSPVLLRLLLPWVSGGNAPPMDLNGMVAALLGTQLLPLLFGLLVRHRWPQLAKRLLSPLELVSKVLSLTAVGLILGSQFQMLMEIRVRGFVGMLILLAASLVLGWLAGGSRREDSKTTALTTALRNVGVGLVIVTGNFAGTPAVLAALAYGILEVLGSLFVALWWRGWLR